jgi:MerC mercury resistance protein
MAIRNKAFWDKLGACASAVCAVHCLLTGVALGLLSTLGFGFFGSPVVDGIFLTVAIAVGGIALWHGVRRHHSYIPALFYVAGILAIMASHGSHLLQGHFEHRHSTLDTILSVVGGICFVLFHVMNLRMQHVHERGECSCCQKPSSAL